jgi:hypothetical protein
MTKQMNQKREKSPIQTVRPAGLKTRRSASYNITTKKTVFDCDVALWTKINALLVISNLN